MPRLSPDSPLPPPSKHFIHICYNFNEFVTINFFFFLFWNQIRWSNGWRIEWWQPCRPGKHFFFSEFCLTFVAVTETSSGEANWKWFENEKASGSKRFFFFFVETAKRNLFTRNGFFFGVTDKTNIQVWINAI